MSLNHPGFSLLNTQEKEVTTLDSVTSSSENFPQLTMYDPLCMWILQYVLCPHILLLHSSQLYIWNEQESLSCFHRRP